MDCTVRKEGFLKFISVRRRDSCAKGTPWKRQGAALVMKDDPYRVLQVGQRRKEDSKSWRRDEQNTYFYLFLSVYEAELVLILRCL